MATLFDADGSDNEGQLTINQSYAEKYDKWREKEEYQKRKLFVLARVSLSSNAICIEVKDKYGEETALKLAVGGDDDVGSSSTSEEEDEDGEVTILTLKFVHSVCSLSITGLGLRC